MTKLEKLYAKQAKFLKDAKDLLESNDELNDEQNEQINRWLSQAEEIEKRAKQLKSVLDQELLNVADQESEDIEKQKRELEEKTTKAGFASFSEYMLSLVRNSNGHRDIRLEALEEKDMAGEVGVSGGFLIPDDQRTTVLAAQAEASLVRPRATIVPMGSRTVPWPAVDMTGGADGVSAFFGGVVTNWTEENTDITQSDPNFREIELHARELMGYTEIPNGLIRDSAVSLEAFLAGPNSFGGAIAWQEDFAFLRGNGVGKPLGVLNVDAAVAVTRNAATDFKFVDAVTMLSKMLMSGGVPVWVMSQTVIPKLYGMVDAGSNNIWLPNAAGTGPGTLLGSPIVFTEKVPALGTKGDVMLIDFSQYLVGDRQIITMDVDKSHKFRANQTAFRIVEAVDGQPWLNASITLADGSTSVSPFVILN